MPVPDLPVPNTLFNTPSNLDLPIKSTMDDIIEITSTLLTYALPLSGLLLFLVIMYAGFGLLTSANNPEQAEKSKQTITTGIIGFLIIFAAYWIAQILQVLFGIPIVSE